MPKREDLKSILIIGSGPIRIGQACEFDYSGAQACRVLRREGYRVILVNSNPATIMTDPEWADATYIEPLDEETLAEIIAKERPDAVLPTLGGQTALNLAMELHAAGDLDRLGTQLIGANVEAIRKAEDREIFRDTVIAAGLHVPTSVIVDSQHGIPADFPIPAIVRPAFTLGGTGGGIAYNPAELEALVTLGLELSPVGQVLIERSVIGWKEYELEVMRDGADNVVIVCSIENLDPMGVHTGDSWTVAPQQTLPDGEYQRLREAAFTCARAVGVVTGGANVQFGYDPATRDLVVIEMNPRVSRSSALASKATGFPIAKLAALLAVGYTLEELPNDITGKTTAAFEPALDYVAVKAPRFDFAKFPKTVPRLGSEMRAVGESLGLGRTFPEAFLKALEGRESVPKTWDLERRGEPIPERWDYLLEAARRGLDLPGIHPYFAEEIQSIAAAEEELARSGDVPAAKRFGLPDRRIAEVLHLSQDEVRAQRRIPGRLAVDSCAAEFEAKTPYFYLSYEAEDDFESEHPDKQRILVLGSGPNRIGQGIEFDYCCVHAVQAFQKLGYEAIMLNSNPETVSTDYDTSDRLYLEPVTLERVLDVCAIEQPLGVVVQLGGQTPLALAHALAERGIPLLGDPLGAIDLAEDRGKFGKLLEQLGLKVPEWGIADGFAEAKAIADRIGYPVLVRPSFVLGGRGMRICQSEEELAAAMPGTGAVTLVDQFLQNAIELDVDILCDGHDAWVAGILEHVEPAGVHSGDSACVIPGPSITAAIEAKVRELATALTRGLDVRGLFNLQLALKDGELWVIEANPRASRTVPFIAKATGIPIIDLACRLMLGEKIADLKLPATAKPTRAWAKEAIFPAERFPEAADRGPEMKSTGEAMAGGDTVVEAYDRVLRAAGRAKHGGKLGPTLQELAQPALTGFAVPTA